MPRQGQGPTKLALMLPSISWGTELLNVVQSIKGLGTTAMAAAKREPSAAVDRLTSEAATFTAEIAGAGRAQVAEFKQRIRDQPLMAVGIAFAVGLLFGRLRR